MVRQMDGVLGGWCRGGWVRLSDGIFGGSFLGCGGGYIPLIYVGLEWRGEGLGGGGGVVHGRSLGILGVRFGAECEYRFSR